MEAKDILQLIAPFVAAGTAVALARRQERERVYCFVDWSYSWYDHEGPHAYAYIGIHNRSTLPIAIRSIRYMTGTLWRQPVEGTALDYEDPTDLSFPYIVQPGEIKSISLDHRMAERIVGKAPPLLSWINNLCGRPRVIVECTTTAGTRSRASAEYALPWDDRQRSARR